MTVDQALCVRLFLKDVGYRNSMQQRALAEANRIIEECAMAALLDFQFQAPDTGQPQGQSLRPEPAPSAAAVPQIPPHTELRSCMDCGEGFEHVPNSGDKWRCDKCRPQQ